MSIRFKSKGNFNNMFRFLRRDHKTLFRQMLEAYAEQGLEALKSATPSDTGRTRDSWYYEIREGEKSSTIAWCNSNLTDRGTPIVILLRYGHATNNGGYVQGYDFIYPSVRPVFDGFTNSVWKEVTS